MEHQACVPSVTKWGELLHMYTQKPTESQLVAEQHEKDILALKGVNRAKTKEPNYDLLAKLRRLMGEIHERREREVKESDSYCNENGGEEKQTGQVPSGPQVHVSKYFNHATPVDAVLRP